MPIDASALKKLIEDEVKQLSHPRILENIGSLLVEPKVVLRDWEFGEPGERYPCWTVLNDDPSNSGVAYCERGFGPQNPWGLVSLGGDNMAMGMDFEWFPSFLDAYFESSAATAVPIWRVFEMDSSGMRVPMSDEGEWDETWARVEILRITHPETQFDVRHNVSY